MNEDEQNSIYNEIGREINEGLISSGNSLEQRLLHLTKAEEMILNQVEASILDNFLYEMVQFINERDQKIRCFTISFIEKACKKDPEIFKKAIATLIWAMTDQSNGVIIQKKVINTCTQIYPVLLRWASLKRSTDLEAKDCWEAFSMLKSRIMQTVDSENEGIKTMAFKFFEMLIICQLSKSEFSEKPKSQNLISLDEISRDSFISWRQLQTEAQQCFENLIEQMSSPHITSLNLVTAISCTCNIARQRPEKMPDVIGALEQLHLNLPPTLGTSQVKSVRKELKMHLLRMLKHPCTFTLHNLHSRMKQLLIELGASDSEIKKAMPTPNEIDETLKRKLAAARQKNTSVESTTEVRSALLGQRRKTGRGETRNGRGEEQVGEEDLDLRDTKRLKMDDEEYDDGTIDLYKQFEDPDSARIAQQKAIDITTEFVLERLSISVVSKLVYISICTLPDEMPPAFASSYTPIGEAGSETQKRHLAKMMAIQMTAAGEGPGIAYIKAEQQKLFVERQMAKSQGATILGGNRSSQLEKEKQKRESTFAAQQQQIPPSQKKTRIQNWSLFNSTRELLPKEAEQLILSSFQRIMNNEMRAVQGGAGLAQQKLLVRLSSRYKSALTPELEAMLINYIIEDQKARADLALQKLAELYAQWMGYSICLSPRQIPQLTVDERKQRYDHYLCTLLTTMHERGEHKETLFHRIFLEAPFLTPGSLKVLRKACLDKVYGAFAITTLRELILTRARQRQELLRLLLEFSYFERNDIKEQCVKTVKELYQLEFLRADVRTFLLEMCELLVQPTAPRVIWHANGRFEREIEEQIDELQWDESLIRAGLYLFLALLPHDSSLLHHLANIYARSGTEIKRVTFRSIEQAIKSIGMHSEDLLEMIENCPPDAETLVARIVHLLTERNSPTPALVDRVRKLHQTRNTDVRSLIPILTGLKKEELLELVPKFVLSAKNSNSVPAFFKKLIIGRHIETNEPMMNSLELLLELHRIKPNRKEQGFLMQNLDLLIIDPNREFSIGKDVLATAVETLLNDSPFPNLLFHTIQRIHESHPALNGFLSNVLVKIAQRRPWEEEEIQQKNREPMWPKFLQCLKSLGSVGYLSLLSQLNLDEFREYIKLANQPDLKKYLHDFVSHLSAHQQSQLKRTLLDFINDRQSNIAEEKSQLEAALDEEMNILGIGHQQEQDKENEKQEVQQSAEIITA